MKKITIFTVCLFLAIGAQAQIGFGVKGGLNFANISASDAFEDPDSKTGYHAGVFAEFGLLGFKLMPEVLVSTKGAEDFDLSYVDVPILLKKNFLKVLNIHAGPQFSFLTKAEADLDGDGNEEDLKDELNGSDIGIVLGAGVNLPAGLTAGARYVWGLSDTTGDVDLDTELRNRTFQVYVGWKFSGN